jgi:hypothetical protein
MPTEVSGVIKLRKALREFEPELAKATQKEIVAALKPIVVAARGYLPANDDVPSGWLKRENAGGRWATRFYDQATARRGIVWKASPSKTNRKGWRSIASIVNKNAGGAIYETAGRKTLGHQGKSKNPEAGQKFIEELSKTGQLKSSDYQGRIGRSSMKFTGRAMFRAFAEDQGKATAAVQKALQKAQDNFYGKTR